MKFSVAGTVDHVVEPFGSRGEVFYVGVDLDFNDDLRALFEGRNGLGISDLLRLCDEHAVEIVEVFDTLF